MTGFTRRGFFGLLLAPLAVKFANQEAYAAPFTTIASRTRGYHVVPIRTLRVESLESTMRIVSWDAKHLQGWKTLPKVPAYSVVGEYEALIPADLKLVDVPELKAVGEPIFPEDHDPAIRY